MSAPPASDPEFLARLSSLELRARTAVEGLAGGRHASRLKGAGLTFAEHRAYVPGDDLRRLDWKVAARTDRHVVRVHEEESSLTGWLLVDTSASMGFGTLGWSKLDYATWTAAALARLLAMQNDRAGLPVTQTFPRLVKVYDVPSGLRKQLETVILLDVGI